MPNGIGNFRSVGGNGNGNGNGNSRERDNRDAFRAAVTSGGARRPVRQISGPSRPMETRPLIVEKPKPEPPPRATIERGEVVRRETKRLGTPPRALPPREPEIIERPRIVAPRSPVIPPRPSIEVPRIERIEPPQVKPVSMPPTPREEMSKPRNGLTGDDMDANCEFCPARVLGKPEPQVQVETETKPEKGGIDPTIIAALIIAAVTLLRR